MKFRGFIFHGRKRNAIFELNRNKSTFPSDNTLLDWYAVNLKIDVTDNFSPRRKEDSLIKEKLWMITKNSVCVDPDGRLVRKMREYCYDARTVATRSHA